MAAIYVLLVATLATALAIVLAVPTNDISNAETACKQMKGNNTCFTHCTFKQLGVLDNEGRYVESNAAEVVIVLYKKQLTSEQSRNIAKACNIVNQQRPAEGCKRALQVFSCFDDERFKILNKRS